MDFQVCGVLGCSWLMRRLRNTAHAFMTRNNNGNQNRLLRAIVFSLLGRVVNLAQYF